MATIARIPADPRCISGECRSPRPACLDPGRSAGPRRGLPGRLPGHWILALWLSVLGLAPAVFGEGSEGGDAWKDAANKPVVVPVRFMGTFNSVGVFNVALNGVNARNTNDFVATCNDENADPMFWTMSTPLQTAHLPIYKTFPITATANAAYSFDLEVMPPTIHDIEKGIGQNIQEYHRYQLFIWVPVERQWKKFCSATAPTWNAENCDDNPVGCQTGNYCVPVTRTWYIQVRPDAGAQPIKKEGRGADSQDDQADDAWDRSEGGIDAETAPGDGDILQMQGSKSDDPASINFKWSVALGRLRDGRTAGRIRMSDARLSTNNFTPAAIAYKAASGNTNEVDVLHSLTNANFIRQIKVPQTLVLVEPLTANSFEMKFYLPSAVGPRDTNGFFTLTNSPSPFVTWRVDSMDGTTNKLRLQEIRNGQTRATTLEYLTAGGPQWKLSRGTGTEARIETRAISFVSSNRQEILEVKNGAGVVSDKTIEFYQRFDWGHELTSTRADPDGANLTTTFVYGTTPETYDYKQLLLTTWPDGYWEKRIYADEDIEELNAVPAGMLWRMVHPWKNSPSSAAVEDCLVSQYDYSSWITTPGPGSYMVQKWHDPGDYVVDHTWITGGDLTTVYEEETIFVDDECAVTDLIREVRQMGDLDHYGEWTDTTRFGPSHPFAGRIYSRTMEFGTVDSYDYEWGQWNAVTRVFTGGLNPPSTNDLRQTIIHGTGVGLCEDAGCEVMSSSEMENDIEDVSVTPFQTTKEVKIIQGGNLVAREEYVYLGALTNWARIDQIIYQRDGLGHATNIFRIDPKTGVARTTYQADWQGGAAFPGDLRLSQVDETGIATTFAYDSLKRVTTSTKLGASTAGYPVQGPITTSLGYDAASRVLTNLQSGGALSLLLRTVYDKAGRKTSETTPDQLTTTYGYGQGGRVITTTYSSGATQVVSNYLDRRVQSVTGSAVVSRYFDYLQLRSGYQGEYTDPAYGLVPKNITEIRVGAVDSQRWTNSITDHRYKEIGEQKPGFASTNYVWKRLEYSFGGGGGALVEGIRQGSFEDEEGQLGTPWFTDFEYDFFGKKRLESRVAEPPYSARLDGMDRAFTHTWRYSTNAQGHWFYTTEKYGYLVDNSVSSNLVERVQERRTGFAASEVSETTTTDPFGLLTVAKVTAVLADKKVTQTTTVPQSSLPVSVVAVNGLVQTETTPTVATPSWHFYDALGREIAIQNPLGFVQGTRFDPATGQVIARTNQFQQVTSYAYYPAGQANAGLLYSETGPTGKKTYFKYDGRGELTHKWGDVPYPEMREYNAYGDLIKLTTYRTGTQWTSASWPASPPAGDLTQWGYDPATGLLVSKTDAAGKATLYGYYYNHLPRTRQWARPGGITSTNLYTPLGDLEKVDYSDSTPDVTLANYDRAGRPRSITDARGTRTITYDIVGRVLSDVGTSGDFSGINLLSQYHAVLGQTNLQVQIPGQTTLVQSWSHDAYGRLRTATYNGHSATYDYLPNSDLLRTNTFRNGAAEKMSTVYDWEFGSRVKTVRNRTTNTFSSHTYDYDALNRRWKATLQNNSYWQYGYDDRNEVTSGKHYWADTQLVAGQQFEYAYDAIGNRLSASSGGNASGANLRATTYGGGAGANNLNQYTSITTPGYEDITGIAPANAAVTVNGNATERKNEYYRHELPIANASAPVWQSVNVQVAGGPSTNGFVLFPPNAQTPTYDDDGNLKTDGLWIYTWDAENRLVAMESAAAVPAAAKRKLEFGYDFKGRRITRRVSTWTGAWTTSQHGRLVLHGWNLVAELNVLASNAPLRSYAWGNDLSGTVDEAGGIAGLMMVRDHGAGAQYYVGYDGNGNVVALVSGSDQSLGAQYEYSPFGELVRGTGPVARLNPFRWSTKYADEETGLSYYGRRFYDPARGRWLGRDPVEEEGGIALYCFVGNNPINGVDPLGMLLYIVPNPGDYASKAAMAQRGATLTQRVRKAVDAFNEVQEIAEIAMDAMTDPSDVIMKLLSGGKNPLSKLVGKDKAGKFQYDAHHLLPKQFSEAFQGMFGDNFDVDKFMVGVQRKLHRNLVHGGKSKKWHGGLWNQAWGEFLGYDPKTKMATKPRSPEEVGKFAQKMLSALVGL